MGSELIAREAEGRMGSIDSEAMIACVQTMQAKAMRARGIIVLVKSN